MMSLGQLAQEYWEMGLDASPMMATLYGLPGFDDQIGDPSKEADQVRATALKEMAGRVEVESPEDVQGVITKQMLLDDIERDLNGIRLDYLGLGVSPLTGPHSGLLMVAGQAAAATAQQAADFVVRYSKVGDWLAVFADRYVESAKAGRTPTATNVQHVIGQVRDYLGSPIESDPIVNTTLRLDWDGEAGWREQLKEVVQTVVRPGMGAYADRLENEVLPIARGDDKPGLLHIPDGPEQYTALLKGYTTTDITAEEIHETGLRIMKELHEEFAEIGEKAFGLTTATEVLDRLRTDPALKYDSAEEIVAAAEETILRAEAAVSDWFNVYPDAKCAVQEVEPELAPSMPPAYYFPPAQDGSRGGTYFINTHEPKSRGAFDAEAIAFHEAVPGHHFDRSISGELEDVPMFRKLGNVVVFTEGWGLYSERLADEMGLYSSEISRLGMVSADAWRAGRLVVDSGIHFKGWARQQAIDYLMQNTPIAEGVIATEVDRYISMPAQAVCYMIGRIAIDGQRQKAEKALGDSFDVKGFHDTVLSNGAIPLNVFEQLVDAWIESVKG